MTDTLTRAERSALMAKVRSRGNQSTEARVELALREHIREEWIKHPSNVLGKPDFYFHDIRLAVFVNGCFWHACPKCGRIPKSRVTFWRSKIEHNRLRDNKVKRRLWKESYHVVTIWEHELSHYQWLKRLQAKIRQLTLTY